MLVEPRLILPDQIVYEIARWEEVEMREAKKTLMGVLLAALSLVRRRVFTDLLYLAA